MQLASEGRRCMYIFKALKITASHFVYRYLLTRIIVLDRAWMVSVGEKPCSINRTFQKVLRVVRLV
jgi:hypothetical protein